MKKNSISEFELEKQEFKIRLKRGGITPVLGDEQAPMIYAPAPTLANRDLLPSAAVPAVAQSSEMEVKSPMIGTFYRAPSPESAPYVDIGTEVGPETVVCIIEAMKVMNEIKAEIRGVITSIPVENAKPVEFGQVLFKVRPL